MIKYIQFSFLFVFFSGALLAQKSAFYTHDLNAFNRAIELYKEKQYLSAQLLFEKLKTIENSEELASDCAYYSAICALHLKQNGGDELVMKFVQNYPTSPKMNQAYVEVAHYYFEEGNYQKAIVWFEKVDSSSMTYERKDAYHFQKGYAFFATKNNKEAAKYFNLILNSNTFGNQAKYYLGYIAYVLDDYKSANNYFEQVGDQEKYKEKIGYFQADMNFKLGNFQKAIEVGEAQFPKANLEEKSELSKIVGESYFNLKKYNQALPFLLAYKGKKGKWTNTDFYQLGYTYYQQKDFENAIAQFNKIIQGSDAVAQNAYYHLAESYLYTQKKQQALNAFKSASEMQFELKIQEDAWLNYAKLSYDIGNPYQSVPEVLLAYLAKYPESSYKQEINSLLISSYITAKNYKEALQLLQKNRSPENKWAYQKVAFYRGLELYIDGDYKGAFALFKTAITENVDPKFSARATFWKGETEYNLDQFEEAKLTFLQFMNLAAAKQTPEYDNANYNLAYSYFKLKAYESALPYFDAYIKYVPGDKMRLTDSYLRLADCNFMVAKYWPAMDAYNKVMEMNSVDADYAAFQKGISYGFVNKPDRKIADLEKFITAYPTSQYADDAVYELGNTYVGQNLNDKAITTYDKLINNYRSSSYTAKAILKQGLLYYNGNNEALAIGKFKKVVAEYPNSPESIEAVATARLIYVDNGKVNEYADWVKSLTFIEVTDADLDNDTYESAEKQYLQNNAKLAISGFTNYISRFPNGLHALKANFYLAQLYFADALENNAIKHYEFVIASPRNEFTEQALARLCQINLKAKNFDAALLVLIRLEAEAEFPQNTTYAQSNLMKAYYEKEDYVNAVVYADKVLKNDKIEDRIKSDAQIIVARSAMKSNDEAKAQQAYDKLNKIAKGELKAEALYYEAYFKNKEGKFDASNKVVEQIAVDYSGYKYFGSKALIIMAKNYFMLGDSFQATEILQSVIDNFATFEDVLTEAQSELERIKSEEAKRNESITN